VWFASTTGTFVDGNTWIECKDFVITLPGSEINQQMHWDHFQVRETTGNVNNGVNRRVIVRNETANTQITSGVFQVTNWETLDSGIFLGATNRVIVQTDTQP
jgi:hypothetical protein